MDAPPGFDVDDRSRDGVEGVVRNAKARVAKIYCRREQIPEDQRRDPNPAGTASSKRHASREDQAEAEQPGKHDQNREHAGLHPKQDSPRRPPRPVVLSAEAEGLLERPEPLEQASRRFGDLSKAGSIEVAIIIERSLDPLVVVVADEIWNRGDPVRVRSLPELDRSNLRDVQVEIEPPIGARRNPTIDESGVVPAMRGEGHDGGRKDDEGMQGRPLLRPRKAEKGCHWHERKDDQKVGTHNGCTTKRETRNRGQAEARLRNRPQQEVGAQDQNERKQRLRKKKTAVQHHRHVERDHDGGQ